MSTLATAIQTLHTTHRVPHILITSVRLPAEPTEDSTDTTSSDESYLSVIGSTATSSMQPRLFRITVPALPVFFSGTGDMFAALTVARLREACAEADLLNKPHWQSGDEVAAADLPLAKAAEKVLASMHAVLAKTMEVREKAERELEEEKRRELNVGLGDEGKESREFDRHLRLTKAAEVKVVRNARLLREPPELERFRARALGVEGEETKDVADELGVLKVAGGRGAIHQT